MKFRVPALAAFACFLLATSASATLTDLGTGAVSDDVLGISWAQDANLCVALGTCPLAPSFNGVMSWFDANAWADDLTYAGFDNWRLPSVDVNDDGVIVDCSTATESECRDNELGYMYYYNLTPAGSTPPTAMGTILTGSQGPFVNIQFGVWSETSATTDLAWQFAFGIAPNVAGRTSAAFKATGGFHVWVVRDNAPASTPEPSTLLLIGVGVVGLLRNNRRR